MALKDMFKPKWKHSDAKVRLQAIGSLKDQNLLAELAKNDESPEVRKAAVGKIEDQSLLSEVVKQSKDVEVREAIIQKINDQNVLAELAKDDESFKVRYEAISNLSDQSLLVEVAKHSKDKTVRRRLAWKIKNQKFLAEMAKNDDSFGNRSAAILMLNDQKMLSEVLKQLRDDTLRSQLLLRITDHKLLFEMSKNDESLEVRKAAILNLNDQSMLIDFLKELRDDTFRKQLAWQITDQKFLAELAKNDELHEVRQVAVAKLLDQSLLLDVIRDSKDLEVRKAAIRKLNDEKVLVEIANNENIKELRSISLQSIKFLNLPDIITNPIGLKLKLIPAGTYIRGSEHGNSWEKPVHLVTITKPFYIGVTPVTQKQWEKIMASNPSSFKGINHPVESITWDDAQMFLSELSKIVKLHCRLPTDAEWEYADRAMTSTLFYWGNEMDGSYAWWSENSGAQTHEVGVKKPNAWGLFDMSGNVSEWCEDAFFDDYLSSDPQIDPLIEPIFDRDTIKVLYRGKSDWKIKESRVIRGGCYLSDPISYDHSIPSLQSSSRGRRWAEYGSDGIGFRVCCDVEIDSSNSNDEKR